MHCLLYLEFFCEEDGQQDPCLMYIFICFFSLFLFCFLFPPPISGTRQCLVANYMDLQQLGTELSGLTGLKKLELEGGYFSHLGLKSALKDLITVHTFQFLEGRLTHLPNIFPGKEYKGLDFEKNRLETIDLDAFTNIQVNNLSLAGNRLRDMDVELFRRMGVDFNKTTVHWQFQQNKLNNSAKQQLFDYFVVECGFTNTSELILSKCNMGNRKVVNVDVSKCGRAENTLTLNRYQVGQKKETSTIVMSDFV